MEILANALQTGAKKHNIQGVLDAYPTALYCMIIETTDRQTNGQTDM